MCEIITFFSWEQDEDILRKALSTFENRKKCFFLKRILTFRKFKEALKLHRLLPFKRKGKCEKTSKTVKGAKSNSFALLISPNFADIPHACMIVVKKKKKSIMLM